MGAAEAVVRLMQRENRESGDSAAVVLIRCIVLCFVQCFLRCVEDIVEFLSYFAYVQVAVRGYSFMDSVRVTFALCKYRNMGVIFGASLVGNVVFMASLLCGLVAGLVSAGVAYSMKPSDAGNNYASSVPSIALLLGIFVGTASAEMILYSMRSGFATVAVCWANDHEELSSKCPELHHDFAERTQALNG